MAPERFEVDGEVFEVTHERRGFAHRYEFTWMAGRHNGDLGFSGLTLGGRLDRGEMRRMIDDFLSRINPDTGYVD